MKNKAISILICLTIWANILSASVIQSFAHSSILDVNYDECDNNPHIDGIDEAWYFIAGNSSYSHLSHQEISIRYYFEDTSEDGSYTWTDTISETEANEIKTAYANSMKKWNDVCFYFHSSDGFIVKYKIINVIEGTRENHNLSIYPTAGEDYYAFTESVDFGNQIETNHFHCSNWKTRLCVYYFSSNNIYGEEHINTLRERTGAHELGHILGLLDVDDACSKYYETDHHHELLMGYGSPTINRSENITYKDIAGVAITRGFHTDSDHKWLNMGQQSNGKHKLVCSICNGVKEVDSLSGYTYNTYNACGENHSLSSGNMFAVASYGDSDYYKCKYCRYVVPFSSIVEQNYSKTYYNCEMHVCVNTVPGLQYTFYEEHDIVGNKCSECETSALEIHNPYRYEKINEYSHRAYCECGKEWTEPHVIESGSYTGVNKYAICLGCRALVTVGMTIHPTTSDLLRTENGSFILPNGVIVLVREDIEAYFAGTLEFYYPDENLETE